MVLSILLYSEKNLANNFEFEHRIIFIFVPSPLGTKRQLNAERQRVSELEDQLSSLSKSILIK